MSRYVGAVEVDDGYNGHKVFVYVVECEREYLAVHECGWYTAHPAIVSAAAANDGVRS